MKFIKNFTTPFFEIESTIEKLSNGHPYYRIKSNDSVINCILSEDDNVYFVRQFRRNLNSYTLEFPAGYVEKNEEPMDASIREVYEELGLTCKPIYLGKYRLLMNRYINYEFLYLCLTNEKLTKNNIKKKFNVVKRKELNKFFLSNKFEQLAAIGLINVVNLKFNVNFYEDENLYNLFWNKL